MARRPTSPRNLPPASASLRNRLPGGLEAAAFFLLLLAVGMRPLISETCESSLQAIARVLDTGATATPAVTAWFNLAIWLAALAATASGALRRARWRWTGLEIGGVVLLIAAAVSTMAASNRRLAANASCDWLTALVMLVVLANLCRDRLRIALVLSVIVASAAASAAKCAMQVGVEFAETRQWYDENKTEIWGKQGIAFDDPRVELFERRMDAREAAGFFPDGNTQAAFLALGGFAALAMGGLVARPRFARMVCLMLAAALFATIFTTGGRGVMVAAAVGVSVWLALIFADQRLRPHWRGLLAGTWLAAILAAAAVVALGSARGGLPGASLTFRWQYWRVTKQIIAENLYTGVGALNFDRAYLPLKPIEYPEEIKDPHNFVMATLSQWGILGGVGLALVLVGASVVAARVWGQPRAEDQPEPVSDVFAWPSAKRWIIALVAGFVVLRLWMMRGQLHQAEGVAVMFFDLGVYGLLWAVCLAGTLWMSREALTVPGDHYRAACLCGIIAFLLHNTIGFSLFFPGTLTPFVAMCAILLARRQRVMSDQQSSGDDARSSDRKEPRASARAVAPSRWPRVVPHGCLVGCLWPIGASVAGLICFLCVVFAPVARCSCLLALARQSSPRAAEKHYLAAAAADSWDPTPPVELARNRSQSGLLDGLIAGLTALSEAIRRDPAAIELYQLRSRLLEMRYQAGGWPDDLQAARAAALKALELYPNSPDRHVELADLLARGCLIFPQWTAEAREHYRRALDLDAARPPHEIRRWPPTRRESVQQRLDALAPPTSTAPATTTA